MKVFKGIVAGLICLSMILVIGCGKQGITPASSVKSSADVEKEKRCSKFSKKLDVI